MPASALVQVSALVLYVLLHWWYCCLFFWIWGIITDSATLILYTIKCRGWIMLLRIHRQRFHSFYKPTHVLPVDLFQPKTDLFSTRAPIWVHFKTVQYFSQPIFRLFSYLKNALPSLVIELCSALFFSKIIYIYILTSRTVL